MYVLRLVARILIYFNVNIYEAMKTNILNLSDQTQGLDKEQFRKKTFNHLS